MILNRLKKLHKDNIFNNTLSPLLFVFLFFMDLIILIKTSFKTFRNYRNFRDTKSLKNTFKDQDSFVLANGPSLKKIDLKEIKKRQRKFANKVICVNSFISKYHSKLIPDFYIISDPAYFGFDEEFHDQDTLKDVKRDLQLIEKHNVTIFVPLRFKNNINIKTKIFYFNDMELRRFNKNLTDITLPRSYKSLTAYKALSLACYLGFKNIYIAGIDNDYFKTFEVDKENRVYYKIDHATEQGGSGKFLLGSIGGLNKNQKIEQINLGKALLTASYSFFDLYRFPKNIINLDENSLIDAFEKRDIFKDL